MWSGVYNIFLSMGGGGSIHLGPENPLNPLGKKKKLSTIFFFPWGGGSIHLGPEKP